MSDQVKKLEKLVRALYEEQRPGRTEWCDWLYNNHVFIVANQSLILAKKYKASSDLAFAGAILHDIADAVTSRFSDNHGELSLSIAEDMLTKAGFPEADKTVVLEDILPKHSCAGDIRPETLEGKIVATADALAHIGTDFYLFFSVNHFKSGLDFEGLKTKLQNKLDRDFNNKLLFEDEKNNCRVKYENLKELFN